MAIVLRVSDTDNPEIVEVTLAVGTHRQSTVHMSRVMLRPENEATLQVLLDRITEENRDPSTVDYSRKGV